MIPANEGKYAPTTIRQLIFHACFPVPGAAPSIQVRRNPIEGRGDIPEGVEKIITPIASATTCPSAGSGASSQAKDLLPVQVGSSISQS